MVKFTYLNILKQWKQVVFLCLLQMYGFACTTHDSHTIEHVVLSGFLQDIWCEKFKMTFLHLKQDAVTHKSNMTTEFR